MDEHVEKRIRPFAAAAIAVAAGGLVYFAATPNGAAFQFFCFVCVFWAFFFFIRWLTEPEVRGSRGRAAAVKHFRAQQAAVAAWKAGPVTTPTTAAAAAVNTAVSEAEVMRRFSELSAGLRQWYEEHPDCHDDDDHDDDYELLSQGVKPWDGDAGAVRAALRGGY